MHELIGSVISYAETTHFEHTPLFMGRVNGRGMWWRFLVHAVIDLVCNQLIPPGATHANASGRERGARGHIYCKNMFVY